MKENISKIAVMCAVLVISLYNEVCSQEFINEIFEETVDTTIIREVGNGTWIVYGGNFPQSAFYLVTDGITVAPKLQLPQEVYISDIEVYGDQVYFCGYKMSNETRIAISGYFNLSTFPSCPVYYYAFSGHKIFKKLDIYYITSPTYERHVVMTGVGANGKGAIVDAFPLSTTQWEYKAYESLQNSEIVDDIAVTDSSIVVSCRWTDTLILRHFVRPTTSNQTIFSSLEHYRVITNPTAASPVLLRKVDKDTVCAFFDMSSNTYMLACLTRNSIGKVFRMEKEYMHSLDLRYIPDTYTIELLFKLGNEGAIFRVPMTVDWNNINVFFGQKFPKNMIWSMDVTDRNNIISSGNFVVDNVLRIFRHNNYELGSCTVKEKANIYKAALYGNNEEELLFGFIDDLSRISMPVTTGVGTIVNICNGR